MPEPIGNLCLVLHAHLPYVLRHGAAPHGEAWLYEAAAEVYLPLLDMIGEVALHRRRPALTVGLTPVLLEQLADDYFKAGFVAYLNERMERARLDRAEFERKGENNFALLAERWETWYAQQLAHFQRIDRDIPAQFAARHAEGHLQLLTSAISHGYLPLLLNDQMIRGQLRAGAAVTRKHLHVDSHGVWLPECAYRPTWEHWLPSVLGGELRRRPGLETFLAAEGLDHFFVDTHLVTLGQPLGVMRGGEGGAPAKFESMSDPLLYWDVRRGWRSPLEPVGVVSEPGSPSCYALARHPRVSEQVWSGIIGYPGSGEYLEFHRKHGQGGAHGLRYHRVTDQTVDLANKEPYDPALVHPKLYQHSQHFCNLIREILAGHRRETGRAGTVVAPFDAELFGHWWFEGPQFLRDVIYTLSREAGGGEGGRVNLVTAEEALAQSPPDKVMRLPEGSWGENGDHGVWINEKTRWMWEVEYRAENTFLKLLAELPWKTNPPVRGMLKRGARQLLLLQASDWPFIVAKDVAADYAIKRFAGHATAFDRLMEIAGHLARGGKGLPLTALQQAEVAALDARDPVFAEIELEWWE